MDALKAALENPAVITVVSLLLSELYMHVAPSQAPMGWLHLASAVLAEVATFLDKVLPQNVVPPAAPKV